MKTPKEKAEELIEKYGDIQWDSQNNHCIIINLGMPLSAAKTCALITIDEVLSAIEFDEVCNTEFWLEVKKEIEKL